MQNWTTYQQAALEYSRLAPRVLTTTFTPTPDSAQQPIPTACLDVVECSYGVRAEVDEVLRAPDTVILGTWAFLPGTLVFAPPPASAADPVRIVYLARHLPDATSQTYPTIPSEHLSYVEDLEQAILLDAEADEMSAGPISYQIGQTQIDRANGLKDLRARAAWLRERVRNAIEQPVARWR